jgi:hypothetical protein
MLIFVYISYELDSKAKRQKEKEEIFDHLPVPQKGNKSFHLQYAHKMFKNIFQIISYLNRKLEENEDKKFYCLLFLSRMHEVDKLVKLALRRQKYVLRNI